MELRRTLGAAVVVALLALPSGAGALTRCEVMAHGEAWVNAGVMYSQGPGSSVCPGPLYSDPWAGGAWYRPDCSGFVSAVWELPTPGHTTYSFAGGPWDDGVSYVIDPADLQPGDAVNYGGNPSAGTGHIRLVGGWAAPGVLWGYEEIFCGQPAQYWQQSWASMAGQYVAIRRVGIAECNAAPRGNLDGATPDGVHVAGWAQDTDSPDAALPVHVYFGGPAGDPAAVGVAATANLYRPDLCAAIGSCNHGFDVLVPLPFRDGAPRPVYAYSFDASTGAPVMLPGSPFQLQAPNVPPVGFLDGAAADGASMVGWAQDADAPAQALEVHVYFGGPAGAPGAVSVAATANVHRPDLCTALGSCAHGFAAPVPVAFRDGAPHPVYAYTFDTTTGTPYLLGGCPAQLVSAPPPPPPPPPAPDAGMATGEDAGVTGEGQDGGTGGALPGTVDGGGSGGTPGTQDGGTGAVLVPAPGAVGCGCGAGPGGAGTGGAWLLGGAWLWAAHRLRRHRR